ncbi:MAG: hypothetical protein Q8M09_13365 [Pseudomonadota bacterium]|nr:hypothetical protein [Pseudomonadota bacterium]MDP1905217.1 hypothetical protein [Pseudomonadota bacterium]MDP2352779.1 hypothetical protein [Pseudomonadota bacterium]
MHPASRILIYLLAALAIPGLPFFLLPMLLLLALSVDFLRPSSRQPWRLIWRTRWLLLVLLLGYAYSLPGEPAMAWLGAASPTQEGLLRGGQQALSLLVLLLWLDVLVLRLPTATLMAGVYTLLRPFTRPAACRTLVVDSENRLRRGQFLPDSQPHSTAMGQEAGEKWTAAVDLQPTIPKSDRLLGLDVQRAALRLGLTLRAIEGLERGRGNLRRLFGENLGADLPTVIHLDVQPMRLRDLALPFITGTLLLWLSA